jgi:hypothetical protein
MGFGDPVTSAPDLVWEIDVPLITDRFVVGALLRVFGITALIMGGLLTLLFGVQGEWDAVPQMWVAVLATCAGLMVLGLLVMVLVFRNRMRFRYTLDAEGIRCETIDRVARTGNRAAIAAGVLLGRPQAAGAGLIARSQEDQRIEWGGAFRAEYKPAARVVVLRNAWRRLMLVYCTPETYAQAAEIIRAGMEKSGAETRVPKRSPLPRYLGWSALAIAATLPLFLLVDAYDVPLLIPLIVLCFALATVWFVGVFGWVVLGGLVVEAGWVVASALEVRESFIRPGETYAHWTVFSGDDWALLALAGAGAAVLVWISVRAIVGRLRPMLMQDFTDMGE